MANDSGLVKVDYAAFSSTAGHLNDLHDQLVQINSNLLSLAQTIAGEGGNGLWSGATARTFGDRATIASQAFNSVLSRFEAANSTIPGLSNLVEDADSRGANLFKASA